MKAAELAQRLSEDAESICRLLLPNGKRQGQEWCIGSIQGEAGNSLKVHLSGSKAGVWRDFAADHGGDLLDLWAAVRGISIGDAIRDAKSRLGIREPNFEGHRQNNFTRPTKPKCSKPTGPVLHWLTDERKLSESAIDAYRLGGKGRDDQLGRGKTSHQQHSGHRDNPPLGDASVIGSSISRLKWWRQQMVGLGPWHWQRRLRATILDGTLVEVALRRRAS